MAKAFFSDHNLLLLFSSCQTERLNLKVKVSPDWFSQGGCRDSDPLGQEQVVYWIDRLICPRGPLRGDVSDFGQGTYL